jgi:hypothetical protein
VGRVYLRRRQRTHRPFKATRGSVPRPHSAQRGCRGARLRAPRRHRFPGAHPGGTPTGGRCSTPRNPARERDERLTGTWGRDRMGTRELAGSFALRKQRESEAARLSLHQPAAHRLLPDGRSHGHLPPPSRRDQPPPRGRLSSATAGGQLHALRHVPACTTSRRRGKGAGDRDPTPLGPLPSPNSPDPLWARPLSLPPKPLTRVGLEVLPQEVAAGEMLEAKVLGDPLAHGALARAGRPEDDRAQEFGSHGLGEEGAAQWAASTQQPSRQPGNFVSWPLPRVPSARAGTRLPPLQWEGETFKTTPPRSPALRHLLALGQRLCSTHSCAPARAVSLRGSEVRPASPTSILSSPALPTPRPEGAGHPRTSLRQKPGEGVTRRAPPHKSPHVGSV